MGRTKKGKASVKTSDLSKLNAENAQLKKQIEGLKKKKEEKQLKKAQLENEKLKKELKEIEDCDSDSIPNDLQEHYSNISSESDISQPNSPKEQIKRDNYSMLSPSKIIPVPALYFDNPECTTADTTTSVEEACLSNANYSADNNQSYDVCSQQPELEQLLSSFAEYADKEDKEGKDISEPINETRKRSSADKEAGFYCESDSSTSECVDSDDKPFKKPKLHNTSDLQTTISQVCRARELLKNNTTLSKEERRRADNNLAAKIFQARKKGNEQAMLKRIPELEAENEQLRTDLERVTDVVQMLKAHLKKPKDKLHSTVEDSGPTCLQLL